MNKMQRFFLAGVTIQGLAVTCAHAQTAASTARTYTAPAAPLATPATTDPIVDSYGNSISGTAVTTGKISNSATNFLDDRLVWTKNVAAKEDPSGPFIYCIPMRKRLLARSATFKTVTITPTGSTAAPAVTASTPATGEYLETVIDPVRQYLIEGPYQKKIRAGDAKCPQVPTPKDLELGDVAYITKDDATTADYRGGFDYGALVVPFKAQMTGKQGISGSAALGGYVGYRVPVMETGLTISPVLFAGASEISVPDGTSGTSQTFAGLSYGVGFIDTIKDSFQIGLIVGFDHVDSTHPYQYNDKPWLSLEIGYSFAQ